MDIPHIDPGPPIPRDDSRSPHKLSRPVERLRWRLAAAAMFSLLLEVFFRKADWGLYAGILVGVAGYCTGDVAANKYGGIALSRTQQASRRRLSLIPALSLFYWGTNFRTGNPFHLFVQSVALFLALLLILGPEPRE